MSNNVTIQDAIKELIRERSVRRRVYPDWITWGKISKSDAEIRLLRLNHAINVLETIITPKQESLFTSNDN